MKLVLRIIWFVILTVVTQIGGVVYVFNHLFVGLLIKKKQRRWIKRQLSFVLFYGLISWLVIPSIAHNYGRTQLPSFNRSTVLAPQNWSVVLCNRSYVSTDLYILINQLASDFNAIDDNELCLKYLDANFPFIDGFPLLPHLSHNDGNKLDLAFRYKDKEGRRCNKTTALLGYGVYEGPRQGETDQTTICKEVSWRYDMTKYIGIPINRDVVFDEEETKRLMKLLVNSNISRIFIEPHLKHRMGLTSEKIRFHGCHAVRHDDHIHVQIP